MLEIWVQGLDDAGQLGGYDITLAYDPAVIRVDSVDGGDAPFDGTPGFTMDAAKGEVTLSSVLSVGGPSAGARIARINISAVGELDDSSVITFTSAELIDGSNRTISATVESGGSATIVMASVLVGSATVAEGRFTTVPVTVSFSHTGGLAGYNISINYDAAIIRIDEILSGDPPFGGTPIFRLNQDEAFVNIVGFHGDRPGPVGSTIVLNMRVTGIARGTSSLGLTVKDLVDAENADSWPAAAIDGHVLVLPPSANAGSEPESIEAALTFDTGTPMALEGAVLTDLTPGVFSELSLPNQNATLTFPAGAVIERGFVAMKQLTEESAPPAPSGRDLGTVIEVNMLDLSGNLLTDVFLPKQATISMILPDSGGSPSIAGDILIQRYEPVFARWLPLNTAIDQEKMVAAANVDRFSIFALTLERITTKEAPATTPSDSSKPLPRADDPDGGGIPAFVIVGIVIAVLALSGAGYLVFRPKRGRVPS